MAVIKCPNQHFYDDSKYSECPHCKKAQENGVTSVDVGENKTVAKYNPKHRDEDNVFTMSLRDSVKSNSVDNQKTVAKYFTDRNMNPIAGWLVCISGENRGRSFEIHMGKNFVGRSMKMDIHTNDDAISRENHFSIVYEPNAVEFYAVQGNGITYHNGKMLGDAVQLVDGDEIEAGASKYLFVPFCREGRDWND